MRIRPLVIALVLMLLVPASALADGGSITGDVYLDGQAAPDMCVAVISGGQTVVASQKTTVDGDYNIYVAQPGSYTVRMDDCGAGFTSTQSYDVEVVSDQDIHNLNAQLTSAGRVTGKLKDDLNAVLTGACVTVESMQGDLLAQTTTDGNGDYAVGGLPPGDVRLKFEGCSAGNYVLEFYEDAHSPANAKPVTVNAGETTGGIDSVLVHGGRITGHVQSSTGAPIGGICVAAIVGDLELSPTLTDSNGTYVLTGIPPSGAYTVGANDCTGTNSWLHEEKSGGNVVAPPDATTVDFTMWHPAFITGHVLGDGSPLASICITAKDTATGEEHHEQTAMNGYYEVNGIHPGTYDLTFSDCKSTGDWVTATTTGVVLGDGQTLLDVDKTLAHPVKADPAAGSEPSTTPGADASSPGETPGPGASGGGDHAAPPLPVRGCKVPKLVGMTLAKARKALAKAGCGLGKVSKRRAHRHSRKGKVLKQKAERGAAKPAGFKVAVTVAK